MYGRRERFSGTVVKLGSKISSLVNIFSWSMLKAGIKAGEDPVASITLFALIVFFSIPWIKISYPE
ncbi:unnamed protein product [marine sediment metagenome]|uniref:Uncharacterized protein n=1 Tax=marine sediment metagenome TaxID=412755 RepID=X0YN79_9ZZZZ